MKKRCAILVFIIILRIGFNIIEVGKWEMGRTVKVTGNVDKIQQSKSDCTMTIGKVWVIESGYCGHKEGEKVRVTGKVGGQLTDRLLGRIWLESPQLSTLKTAENKPALVDKWRENLVEIYTRLLPEPEASLVAGVVLGWKGSLSKSFNQELINSGTIHIVVASGYNVMVVASFGMGVFLYLVKRRWATMLSILLMVMYGILAGGEAPVVRAVIMGGLVFIGQVAGRGTGSGWMLFLAASVMLIFEPLLVESLSFQLTMAASFGLMVVSPVIERWLMNQERLGIVLRTELVPTFSTMLMTAPLIWWNFGRVSFIGLISNLLVLPLVPMVMLSGSVMLVLGLIWLPLGYLVMPVVYALAHMVVLLIKLFG